MEEHLLGAQQQQPPPPPPNYQNLHHPITTFFYFAVIGGEPTSAALSIGTLGFIQSLGDTIGGPLVGLALDKYGPYIPIAITATACSFGCLCRGFAKDLFQLQLGSIFNGVGVNLWTVVLGHLVKSFDPRMRSEVLSRLVCSWLWFRFVAKHCFHYWSMG